jgi:[acyl-carrier-protein] S-malonyltransferase
MQRAVSLGVTEGLEVGAGKVLMGLMRGISRDVKVTPVENSEDLPEGLPKGLPEDVS